MILEQLKAGPIGQASFLSLLEHGEKMAERGNFAQVAEDRIGLGVRPVRELSDFVKNVPSSDEKILQAIVVEIGHTVGPAGHFQGRPGQAAPACDINKDTVAAITKEGEGLQFGGRLPDVWQPVIVQIAKPTRTSRRS